MKTQLGTELLKNQVKQGEVLDRKGRWEEAGRIYSLALEEARQNGDVYLQARLMRKLGDIERKRGNPAHALCRFRACRKLLDDGCNQKELAHLYNNIGLVFFNRGKWKPFRRYLARSLRLARNRRDHRLMGQIFNNLGIMYHIQGRAKKSIHHMTRAMECYSVADYVRGIAQTYNNLGMIYRDRKMWGEALKYYDLSIKKSKQLEDNNLLGINTLNIATAMNTLQQPKKAKEFCGKALNVFIGIDDQIGMGESYLCYGSIYRQFKKSEIAERYLRESLKIHSQVENSMGMAEVNRELGLLYLDQGKRKEALCYFRVSLRLFRELNADPYIGEIEKHIKELTRNPSYS